MFSEKKKDKQILDAIIKSDSMNVVGRGTLTLDPQEIVSSPKFQELLKSTSKEINKASKQ
ncbi:hypothetical protein ACD661_04665 [Legionella lytica]|uniref:Uncharacterized protein n=1 Tax=Legionella lytica TaxID=96232 RepID=A0ABW8D579_9GAMM